MSIGQRAVVTTECVAPLRIGSESSRHIGNRASFRAATWSLASLLVACAPLAFAQPDFRCAAVQPSASKLPSYRRIAGEARCEGYFEQSVSQPFVELVSLTREVPGVAPPGAVTVLRIRPTQPIASQLLIQPLRPSPFYRVDVRLEPVGLLQWDADPMLRTTGLRLADLGFVARAAVPNADAPAIVPVAWSQAGGDERNAYAVLRASVAVSSVAARVYRMETGEASASAWRELPGTPLYAWDPIVLPVALPADGRDVRVDVRALTSDRRTLPMLHFIVAGRQR